MAYQVPRMSAEESRAWLALISTAELLPAALDAQLQVESNLTHFEFIVLSALRQAKNSTLRMKELAAASHATLPRLSKVVSRLQTRGLVDRSAGAGDGRAVDVTLTTAGRRALVRAVPSHIAYVRELVIETLTPGQLSALADALEPIVARLDPQRRLAGQNLAGAGGS